MLATAALHGGGSGDDGDGLIGGDLSIVVGIRKNETAPAADAAAGGGGNRVDGGGEGGESPSFDVQRFDHIRYTLIGRGASRHDVFLDTSSAQYAALVWLTRDDPRMLDPESAYLEQRYGLAVLYFGTTRSGYEWHVPKVIDDDADTNGEGGGGGGGEGDEEAVGPENDDDEYGDDEYDKDDGDADYGENADDDDVVGRVRRRDLAIRRRGTVQTTGKDASGWFRHENWLSSYGVCSWEGVTCPQQRIHDDGGGGGEGATSKSMSMSSCCCTIPYTTMETYPVSNFGGIICTVYSPTRCTRPCRIWKSSI
jgi:hypothetical protein